MPTKKYLLKNPYQKRPIKKYLSKNTPINLNKKTIISQIAWAKIKNTPTKSKKKNTG